MAHNAAFHQVHPIAGSELTSVEGGEDTGSWGRVKGSWEIPDGEKKQRRVCEVREERFTKYYGRLVFHRQRGEELINRSIK